MLRDSIKFGSVCSGIEAASVAWHPLGWQASWFSEIEKFPSAVLAHHYPNVPNLGDMTKYKEWPDAAINVLVGGTPCQSFSVAGLRKGLDDPRGNLTLTYLAIAARYRPRWLVWENVPGVLSDRTGAFGSLLGGLADIGYGWAYRVLDAQYFGLAQRRRRVFVVGYLGGWASAAAVLFERDSLQGNPAPSKKAWKDTSGSSGNGIARCITTGEMSRLDWETCTFVTEPNGVRRLTPIECERLQGFPDQYTAIPWRNKTAEQCPDSPRYKALGNSMAVPCMRWIGSRIQEVEDAA